MATILASNLQDMTVMSDDGREFGTLYQITMDLESGELPEIIIEPNDQMSYDNGFEVDDNGHYHIPVQRITAVGDHLVFAR